MKEAQRKYFKKLKAKQVIFYLKDNELLEYANQINFQKFVKDNLRKEIKEHGNKNENTNNL